MLKKTILVPVDGTPVSEAALPFAEALADRLEGGVLLVRAAHAPPGLAEPAASQAQALAAAEDYLALLQAAVAERGIPVKTAVPFGAATAWIAEEVAIRRADLVVMATHARTGLQRLVNGSVAERVIADARVPVMLVRGDGDPGQAERLRRQRPTLVVPLDGSALAEAALPVACELALGLDADLVLVGVVPPPGQLVAGEGSVTTYVAEDAEQLAADARDYLASVAARLGGGRPAQTVVRSGVPSVEIGLEAEARGAAAVVMGTRGRTGLIRSLLGSVAGEVVHRGTTPVVLVRPTVPQPSQVPAVSQLAAEV